MKKWKKAVPDSIIKKVVGTSLSLQLIFYISLFGQKHGLSNSEILRIALRDWFYKQKETYPIDFLISEIKKEIQNDWDLQKIRNVNIDLPIFYDYLEKNTELLKNRGVEKGSVDKIITSIKFKD